MKKLISFLFLALCTILYANAENKITINTSSGHPGDVVNVSVGMNNTDAVTAVQVVIPIDNQLSYVEGSATLNASRSDGHRISASSVNGQLKIYIYSLDLKPIKGISGELCSFQVKLGKSPKSYSLKPEVKLTNASGAQLTTSYQQGEVKILSPQLNITTSSLDYGHIPIRSTYTRTLTMQNTGNEVLNVTGIDFSAQEFSATEKSFSINPGYSKSITISYAPVKRGKIEETVSVVSNAINGTQKAKLVADPFSVNELYVGTASGISDEEVEIPLTVKNMELDLVGMQATLTLPSELVYVEGSFKTSDRTQSHTATASCNGNTLRLILYSSHNKAITGTDGVIGTFKVRLNGQSGTYSITPTKVTLSNTGLENMTSAFYGGYATIKSPTINCNSSLDLGDNPVNAPVEKSFVIQNTGQVDLTISKVTFLDKGFSVKESLPIVIPAWQSKTITIVYLPSEEGSFTTTMNIYSNDPACRLKNVRVGSNVYEPNNINVTGENLENNQYRFDFSMSNYTDIVAAQIDFHWIDGVSASNSDFIASSRLANHSYSLTKRADGSYRVVIYSVGNKVISGTDGNLFSILFHSDDNIIYRDSKLVVDKIKLSSSNAINYNSTDEMEYTARFTNFYVNFIVDDEVISSKFLKTGTEIEIPQPEEKVGYTFSGWGNVAASVDNSDLTYSGTYNINQYNVTYYVDDEVYQTNVLDYGATLVVPEAPIKPGYEFVGWGDMPIILPASDLEFYAEFKRSTALGDVNMDGDIDILDVVATLSIMKGMDSSMYNLEAADANNDGSTDILDVIRIIEIMKQ